MTGPFTLNELENWRTSLDFPKIGRQLQAARQNLERDAAGLPLKPNRARVLDALGKVYSLIEFGEYDAARNMFRSMDTFLRDAFGWNGTENRGIPRPLSRPALNGLYWDASLALLGYAKPRPKGDGNWKNANRDVQRILWSLNASRSV